MVLHGYCDGIAAMWCEYCDSIALLSRDIMYHDNVITVSILSEYFVSNVDMYVA